MHPAPALTPARALARHCPELLKAGPEPAALLPLLARAGTALARALAPALAPLLGGIEPMVEAAAVRQGSGAELGALIEPVAGNGLLALDGGDVLLISTDAAALLRMVDRTFGGRGDAPRALPDSLPMAAELMAARVETLVTEMLAGAVMAVCGAMPRLRSARRHCDLAELAPFAPDTALALQVITVRESTGVAWDLVLALPLTAVAALLGAASADPPQPPPRPLALANAEPFAGLPLPLSAVLVDMLVPFATIAALVPGQVLPVALARMVPIRIGEHRIAQGAIGALDDRVAIQLSHAFAE